MRVPCNDRALLPALLLGVAAILPAQDPPTGKSAAELLREIEQLRTDQDEALEDFDRRLAALAGGSQGSDAGTNKFWITGYATASYMDRGDGNSTFGAGFRPLFLWQLGENLLFEAELEVALEGGVSEVDLEYAQLSYVVNDYMVVGIGKFLNPGNYFIERLHPSWINKLPDRPLAFGHDGLISPSQVGVTVHGAVPVAGTKVEYSTWVSNGPSLVTDDEEEAGHLRYNNYQDANNSKNYGGRLGFFLSPEFQVGYSIEMGRVDATGETANSVDTVVQSVDLNWIGDCDLLGGTFDVRGQWVHSDADFNVFDADGALGFGPVFYNNKRSGGYAQVAFRPAQIEALKDFEGVIRYDVLDMPSGSSAPVDRQRTTIGINYWINPSTVMKFAYQVDNKDDPSGAMRDTNAVMFQVAVGF